MKMDPPISMEDLEVTHRMGKPSLPSGQIDQPAPAAQPVSHGEAAEVPTASALPSDEVTQASRELTSRDVRQDKRVLPRPILVKFVSRRVKADVMNERKELKGKKLRDATGHEAPIFIQDDLTQRRANLAYQARQLKRNKLVMDTWISFGKIMVKDNHSLITTVNCTSDLSFSKYEIVLYVFVSEQYVYNTSQFALWILMLMCFSARAPVATVQITHPNIFSYSLG